MAKRKPTTYNILSKQFTKINNKLPEERKLSIQQRRQIIKNQLLPAYKDTPKYKLRAKAISANILKIVDKLPPKEICDLNYIDPSAYSYVEWFALDDTIRELVPDCIFVKVSAGLYGETKIFNTRNYEYGGKGVRAIVESIRQDAENMSGTFIFSGYQKLKKGKKNDGTPENYYLDFVLFEVSAKGVKSPYGEPKSVKYALPKTRDVKRKKTKIKKVIEDRIKQLKSKQDSKRRAKKTLQKNITQFTKTAQKLNKAKKPSKELKATARKQFIKTTGLVEKYLAQGKLTQNQYDRSLEKILKNFYEE